jgi:Holliday junction DNA helicase RuvA
MTCLIFLSGVVTVVDSTTIHAATSDRVYEFAAPGSWFKDTGAQVVFTYCHQDNNGCQSWFAFPSREARRWFLDMIKAQGVGPVSAIKIMSKTTFATFTQIMETTDREAFARLPGVGPKTGQKLIPFLFPKDKASPKVSAFIPDDAAVQVMMALGYKAAQAKEVVIKAMQMSEGEETDTEKLVKRALALMSK